MEILWLVASEMWEFQDSGFNWVKVVALALIIHCKEARASNDPSIQEFLMDNGHRHVDIFYNSSQWRGVTLTGMFVSRLHIGKVEKVNPNSFGIFVVDPQKDDLGSYLSLIIKRRIRTSLLIVSKPWHHNTSNLIHTQLSLLQPSAFFYMALSSTCCMDWHQVISLKSGSIINVLKFADNSSRVIETFDLHGLKITSTSLTWAPYLTIDDCNEYGLECAKNNGYLKDFMDMMASQFNFSYVSQKNVGNNWGTLPINDTYVGVYGNIISKHYDMSLSTWLWTSARNEMCDFVPFLQRGNVLALKPQKPKIDFGLFTRAFVQDTWVYVLFMAGSTVLLTLLTNQYGVDKTRNAPKIMMFIWWIFFTLVNSYYCGVLTMFFTTTSPVPFKTMSDVIQAYPNWKFRFQKGWFNGWLYEMTERGEPDFIKLWQRYQENPAETTYSSIKNGLELIESGPNVIFADGNMILANLKKSSAAQKIYMISLGKHESYNLIFYKNSPLLPMFKQGASDFRETGLERQLFYKWFGEWAAETNTASSEQKVLTLGHMVLVFAIMLAAFVITLIVLCGELAFQNFLSKVKVHDLSRVECRTLPR